MLAWWALSLLARSPWQPVPVTASAAVVADPLAVSRALGMREPTAQAVATPAPAVAARLRLLGVVSQAPLQGAALIAIDGQPPRPYRVGQRVSDNWVLREVGRERALLQAADGGGDELELLVPPLPR